VFHCFLQLFTACNNKDLASNLAFKVCLALQRLVFKYKPRYWNTSWGVPHIVKFDNNPTNQYSVVTQTYALSPASASGAASAAGASAAFAASGAVASAGLRSNDLRSLRSSDFSFIITD